MKEYQVEFQPSVWEDMEAISDFIMNIAYVEDVRYVTQLILNAIYELENPFLSGSFPYSNEILIYH